MRRQAALRSLIRAAVDMGGAPPVGRQLVPTEVVVEDVAIEPEEAGTGHHRPFVLDHQHAATDVVESALELGSAGRHPLPPLLFLNGGVAVEIVLGAAAELHGWSSLVVD